MNNSTALCVNVYNMMCELRADTVSNEWDDGTKDLGINADILAIGKANS